MGALKELYEEMKDCRRCALSGGRTNLVFGAGNENAEVMFVGEAPGYYEAKEGKPFVGAAGKLLTGLLEGIGLKRSDIYIANVLKCRPPGNRDPEDEEIAACKPFLYRQMEIIKPKVICTLGNFATQAIFERRVSISKVRGTATQVKGYFVFPLYHPAVALHRGGMLEPLREDFGKLRDFLADIPEPKPPEKKPQQLSLFDM